MVVRFILFNILPMEKLLELLNEYRTEKGERNLNESEVSQTLDSLNYLRLFIDWLVNNEKINLNKIKLFSIFNEDRYYNAYQSILMALSISDNPIEFLISILK